MSMIYQIVFLKTKLKRTRSMLIRVAHRKTILGKI
jgi:hypothetical protein